MKICLIDNYDSFTFNVEHQLLMLDHEVDVIRNDKISIDEISQLDYDALVIGPGPSNPKNAGISFCLLYTSPSPRDQRGSRMPSSA